MIAPAKAKRRPVDAESAALIRGYRDRHPDMPDWPNDAILDAIRKEQLRAAIDRLRAEDEERAAETRRQAVEAAKQTAEEDTRQRAEAERLKAEADKNAADAQAERKARASALVDLIKGSAKKPIAERVAILRGWFPPDLADTDDEIADAIRAFDKRIAASAPSSSVSHPGLKEGLDGAEVLRVGKGGEGNEVPPGGSAAGGLAADTHQTTPAPRPEPQDAGVGPLPQLLESGCSFPEYIEGLFAHADVVTAGVKEDWQSRALPLVRWVKAYPGMVGTDATEAWAKVSRCVRSWKGGRTADEWWEGHFGITEEDADCLFRKWWSKVVMLPTADPLEYALDLADEWPIGLLPEIVARRSKEYPRFISLCAHLQRNLGTKRPITLPVARIAKLLGRSMETISEYREKAVADGYLEPVWKADRRVGRAAGYRFVRLDRWDWDRVMSPKSPGKRTGKSGGGSVVWGS